jgi:hypothetical protein
MDIEQSMLEVLKRYAIKYNCKKESVQVLLYLNPKNGEVGYKTHKDYFEIEEQSVKEVLDIKDNLLNRIIDLAKIVNNRIKNMLIENSERLEIAISDFNALVVYKTTKSGKEGIRILLYNKKEFIEEMKLDKNLLQ